MKTTPALSVETRVDSSVKKSVKIIAVSVLILLGAFSIAALRMVPAIRTQYSVKQFLPENHKTIESDTKVKQQFGLSETSSFIATLSLKKGEKGSWLQTSRIRRLAGATERIREMRGVSRALSLATVEGASTVGNGITIGRLLELTPPHLWPRRVLGDPLVSPTLISRDGRTVLLLIEVGDLSNTRLERIHFDTRALLKATFSDSVISVGGVPAIQSDLSRLLSEELKLFLLMSFLACAVTLFSFFRNISSLIVPFVLTFVADVAMAAMMALAHVPFTVLSAAVPILVSITVVGMTVHTMLRMSEIAHSIGPSARRDICALRALRELFLPNLLASLTTCIGFLTLLTASVPVIRQFGATVGGAIMISWLVTTIGLVPLLILLPTPMPRRWTRSPARWVLMFMQQRRWLVPSIAAASLILVVTGLNLRWTARLLDDLPRGQETRRSSEHIDRFLGGLIPFDVVVHARQPDAWNDPERLEILDRLLRNLRGDRAIGSAQGLPDYLRASRLAGSRVSASRAANAEIYMLYSLSPENPLVHFLTSDGRSTRLGLLLRDIPGDRMRELTERVRRQVGRAFPEDRIELGGMATTVHILNNELSRDLIFGLWQALAAITILMIFVFRSLRWALVACVPNLIPPAVLMGAMAISATPIKPGIALVFSIALGLAFTNTAYLLVRLRDLTKGRGSLPVAKAFYLESNPCLISTLIVFVGFAVFLFSRFSINQTFGVFMLLSILAGCVGDLVLLPALLRLFPGLLQPRKPVGPLRSPVSSAGGAVATGLALITLLQATPVSAKGTIDAEAKKLLLESGRQMDCRDEIARLKMSIIEANGSRKERLIDMKRKGDGGLQRLRASLQSPPDLRGMSFLSHVAKESEKQWIYLPSSKQTRRIVGGGGESGILGSDLTYQDLNPAAIRSANLVLLHSKGANRAQFDVLEARPDKSESRYRRVLIWLQKGTGRPLKVEYFGEGDKRVKEIAFNDYKQFAPNLWRAQQMIVRNLQTNRRTEISLLSLKVNSGLTDDEFTVEALGE